MVVVVESGEVGVEVLAEAPELAAEVPSLLGEAVEGEESAVAAQEAQEKAPRQQDQWLSLAHLKLFYYLQRPPAHSCYQFQLTALFEVTETNKTQPPPLLL